MDLGVLTGVALLCTTAPIALVVLAFAWRSRTLPGVRAFLAIITLALWWSTGSAVELLIPGLDGKLVWSNLEFLSITLLPVAFLALALDYTGRRGWVTPVRVAALCVLPLVTNVLLWADHHRHLMRSASWLDVTGSYPVVGHSWGPWFWVHAGYSYLLLALSVGLLLTALISQPQLHRKRLVAILVGVLLPLASGLVETFAPSSSSLDDATPAVFILAALLLAWGLLRVRIFSIVPIARHALVENMKDGVLVLDDAGQVVDLNESARQLIGRPKAYILGRPLADCWDAWGQITVPYAAGASQAQLRLQIDGRERHYEVRSSPLAQREHVVAHMVVLSDVTDRVLLEDSLRDQALTDGLTGLPNRALFTAKLGDTIRQSRRHEGSPVCRDGAGS